MKTALLFSAALGLAAAWGWTRRGGSEELLLQRQQLLEFWPVLALSLAAGLTGGLAWRDRVVSGAGYSSPLQAWIGKRILVGGCFVVSAWATSPAGAPGTPLWIAAGALLAGALVYVANLPARL